MSDSDPITRLNAALEGRHHSESEVGEGGMATVYLASDLRHELKVLKPELAAVVGADRGDQASVHLVTDWCEELRERAGG